MQAQGITPEMLIIMLSLSGISGIEIESITLTEDGELHIKVRSIVQGTVCHSCGCHIENYYCQGNEVKLRHLSVFNLLTYILITPSRYKCCHCEGRANNNPNLALVRSKSNIHKAIFG